MASINVYNELFCDPRMNALAGLLPRHIAYGAVVALWEVGQSYWKKRKGLIPTEIFALLACAKELEATGWVERREDGIYCRGAEERWAFLLAPSEAGKRSAEVRRARFGTAQPPHGRQERSNDPSNKHRTPSNGIEPSSSSSSSSSSSFFDPSSSSPSSKKEDLPPAENRGRREKKVSVSGVPTWEAYAKAYETRYGVVPPRDKTANTLCKNLTMALGQEASPQVAAFFLTHHDRFYVQAKHPLTLLMRDRTKLYTEWKTGRRTTSSQARDVEVHQTNIDAVKAYVREKGGN